MRLLISLIVLSACSTSQPRTGAQQPGLGMTPHPRSEPSRGEQPREQPRGGDRGRGDGERNGSPGSGSSPGPATSPGKSKVCLQYQPKYLDGDGLNGVDALGAKVVVRKADGGDAWSGRLSDEDGCSPEFPVEGNARYIVGFTSDVQIHGNTVSLKIQNGAPVTQEWRDVPLTPGQGRTFVLDDSPMVRILAGMTLGFQRESQGITGKTIQVWQKVQPDATPCPGTSCNNNGQVYYMGAPSGGDQTTGLNTMLHELGHKVMFLRVGLDPDQIKRDKDAPGTGKCRGDGGHRRDSVEWQSLAIIEGFAHFYASAVLNPGANASCRSYSHYPVDWNHDRTQDGKPYRCDGPPVDGLGLSATDYMGDQCGPRFVPGTANEYDYQRFFWDLHRGGLTVNQIIDVIGAANHPSPWNATYAPGSSANPKDRMQAAAEKMGFGPAWAKAAHLHGVDR